MRVAIVHYWFVSWRGGEKVIESLLEMFPQADVFTHVLAGRECKEALDGFRVVESFIARLPNAANNYQKYLPLMPLALEQLDLRGYDLVISSESGPAKGVLTDPGALHICYCHSPMRYLWDMYHDYRESAGWLTRSLMPLLTHYLRTWDQNSANRVDYFIANSDFVRRRIRKVYRRDAAVIHPPVSVDEFRYTEKKDDYYLMLGQLTKYKRADLAVDAFQALGDRRLVVIGEGELLKPLKSLDLPNVQLLGRQPFDQLKSYLEKARALIFPGIEDFGIVPVEALASGTPVIAFGKGGALETIIDHETGILFHEQTGGALIKAVADFEEWEPRMDRTKLRYRADTFSGARFRSEIEQFINSKLAEHGCGQIGGSVEKLPAESIIETGG